MPTNISNKSDVTLPERTTLSKARLALNIEHYTTQLMRKMAKNINSVHGGVM